MRSPSPTLTATHSTGVQVKGATSPMQSDLYLVQKQVKLMPNYHLNR